MLDDVQRAVRDASGRNVTRECQPDKEAFIERFNRTYRDEVFDVYVFASLTEVQMLTDDWLLTTTAGRTTRRPHPPCVLLAPAPNPVGVHLCIVSLTEELA